MVCMCSYVAVFAWSWGPLGRLVPSEIFPLEIQSTTQSIAVLVKMLFMFLIADVNMLSSMVQFLMEFTNLVLRSSLVIEEDLNCFKLEKGWGIFGFDLGENRMPRN